MRFHTNLRGHYALTLAGITYQDAVPIPCAVKSTAQTNKWYRIAFAGSEVQASQSAAARAILTTNLAIIPEMEGLSGYRVPSSAAACLRSGCNSPSVYIASPGALL